MPPPPPPGPVQTSHKKDGHQRRPHRFHVSCPPPPHPVTGSDAGNQEIHGPRLQSLLNLPNQASTQIDKKLGCHILHAVLAQTKWQQRV